MLLLSEKRSIFPRLNAEAWSYCREHYQLYFKCKSFILSMVNYCTALNINLFQSVLSVSENSLVFFLSIPHSSVLMLCYILNTDFCLACGSFCSAAAFHGLHGYLQLGSQMFVLVTQIAKGCMGMKEKSCLGS